MPFRTATESTEGCGKVSPATRFSLERDVIYFRNPLAYCRFLRRNFPILILSPGSPLTVVIRTAWRLSSSRLCWLIFSV